MITGKNHSMAFMHWVGRGHWKLEILWLAVIASTTPWGFHLLIETSMCRVLLGMANPCATYILTWPHHFGQTSPACWLRHIKTCRSLSGAIPTLMLTARCRHRPPPMDFRLLGEFLAQALGNMHKESVYIVSVISSCLCTVYNAISQFYH